MAEEPLEERKARILRAVVQEYVATAQPVASQHIARASDLGVSSATVRNDMTILEREGYLVQPHTSAGRIPTDRGYRYFVDHFTSRGSLPPGQRRAVADFFTQAHGALEGLLHETSHLLTGLTRHAAVVTAPEPELATVRSVTLVPLAPRQLLAVVVLSNGGVDKATVLLDLDVDDGAVQAAGRRLADAATGRTLADLPAVAPTGAAAVDEVVAAARDVMAQETETDLYVGGASRLAAEQDAFRTFETTERLLELLEQQVVVVTLVRDMIDDGVTVKIGEEHELKDLRDCSIVVAPYEIGGRLAGTVGVLGPTRMDYEQALAAVAAVSERLGRLLSG